MNFYQNAALTVAFVCLSMTVEGISAKAQGIFNPAGEIVHHGGGCRKDSPQGYCCHAGSKPYHCH